jgi:hypothetical protein
MLETLALTVMNAVVSSCVKYYLSSLLAGGGIDYKKSELGYSVPSWYMNPKAGEESFLGYGTSTTGDEFESIDDAKEKAIKQMVETMRLSSRALIADKVKYDKTSVKQQALVVLFVRSDGLDEFVRLNAAVDEKKLVKVTQPQPDMRAFVRIRLDQKVYVKFQEERLKALKIRIVQQKTEDLLAEIEADQAASSNKPPVEVVAPPATPPPENTPAKSGAEDLDKAGAKVPANKSDGRFGGLEKELDSQSK